MTKDPHFLWLLKHVKPDCVCRRFDAFTPNKGEKREGGIDRSIRCRRICTRKIIFDKLRYLRFESFICDEVDGKGGEGKVSIEFVVVALKITLESKYFGSWKYDEIVNKSCLLRKSITFCIISRNATREDIGRSICR